MITWLTSLNEIALRRWIVGSTTINDLIFIYYFFFEVFSHLEQRVAKILVELTPALGLEGLGSQDMRLLVGDVMHSMTVILGLTVTVFLVFHIIVYWSFLRSKPWTRTYLKVLAWTGVLFGIFVILFIVTASAWHLWYLLVLPPLYIFTIMALKIESGRETGPVE